MRSVASTTSFVRSSDAADGRLGPEAVRSAAQQPLQPTSGTIVPSTRLGSNSVVVRRSRLSGGPLDRLLWRPGSRSERWATSAYFLSMRLLDRDWERLAGNFTLIVGGTFFIGAGLLGYETGRMDVNLPRWRGSPIWFEVLLGATLLVAGLYRTVIRKGPSR